MTDTENLESIVNSPEATNAELAKSDDVTAYVEERHGAGRGCPPARGRDG